MHPESDVPTPEPPTPIRVGEEDAPTVLSGTGLAEAVADVPGTSTLLIGESRPPDAEVAAMAQLIEPGGWVARAVPVTDALKTVERGLVTGTVDRAATVVLRLPVLAPTSMLRAVAAEAGDREIDLMAALAAAGPVTVFTRE